MTATMLANHVWQSTIAAGIAWLITIALRRNRAAARSSVWLAASCKFLVPFAALVSVGGSLGWRTVPIASPSQVAMVMDALGEPFSMASGRVAPVVPVASAFSIPRSVVLTSLLVVWLAGCAAMLLTWFVRWRRVRTVVRMSGAIDDGPIFDALRRLEQDGRIAAPIAVVVSDGPFEPGVFGILQPVLLWPRRIAAHLDEAQIEAILAHEVAHVRRHDNLAAAAHMVVQSLFWFHPLVWWIGSRLVEERERACDEDVLRLGSAPQTYAESILRTCQFCVESPLVCVAGVTGSNLKKRIEHIMTNEARATLNHWTRGLLAMAATAAIVAPVMIGMLNAPRLRAQAPAAGAADPTFEVASVKANKDGDNRILFQFQPQPGGRFRAGNVRLRDLIAMAYGTPQPLTEFQITGGPTWIESERFDIIAKAPGDPQRGPNGPAPEMFLMLRSLLAERFQLTVHRETREAPVYALVLARSDGKLGPQLHAPATDCAALMAAMRAGGGQPPAPPSPAERPPCGLRMRPGNFSGGSVTMAQLTNTLARFVGRTVVDRSGLTGNYDVDLDWTPDQMSQGRGDPPPGAGPLPVIDPNGPSIFTAVQEQLGLKLESTKGPVDVLVIDRVEHPTED